MPIAHLLRRAAFRTLEALSERLNAKKTTEPLRTSESGFPAGSAQRPDRSVWIFASTIGELNATQPFVDAVLRQLGDPPLVLLTDRTTYHAAYAERFPAAHIIHTCGTTAEARALRRRFPPFLLLVAEIPCVLHDAPCRFSHALIHSARGAGARCVLVNGWLYGYLPSSRIDAIEKRLLGHAYLQCFDLLLAQTEGVREQLLRWGAQASRVVVTGNLKFDAMAPTGMSPAPIVSSLSLRRECGPVIVAGSVTETPDQLMLLSAFRWVLARYPDALLVLAPRHPENTPRMTRLLEALDSGKWKWRLRSGLRDFTSELVSPSLNVVVLDTMGELRSCYSSATLTFVGQDHNLLEPLAFDRPVFTYGQWEPTYPSYPVYSQLKALGLITHTASAEELGQAWVQHLSAGSPSRVDSPRERLRSLSGALSRALEALTRQPWWQQLCASRARTAR